MGCSSDNHHVTYCPPRCCAVVGTGAYTFPTNMIDWATVTIGRGVYLPVIYRQ